MRVKQRRKGRGGEPYLFRPATTPPAPENSYAEWFSGNASAYERIYKMVRRIPRGKVTTYGEIARMVGGITARMVGYAMAALRGRNDVPWQRVLNYKGGISPRTAGDGSIRQRIILEAEGIRFDSRGRVDLKKVGWPGPGNRLGRRGTAPDGGIGKSTSGGRRKR